MIINPIPINKIRKELDTTNLPKFDTSVQKIGFFLNQCETMSRLLYPFPASFQMLPRSVAASPEFYKDLFRECFAGEELEFYAKRFGGFFDVQTRHVGVLFGVSRRTSSQQRSPTLRGLVLQYSPINEMWTNFIANLFTEEDSFDLFTSTGLRFRASHAEHPRARIEMLIGHLFVYSGWNQCSVRAVQDKKVKSGKSMIVDCNIQFAYPDFVQVYDRIVSAGDIQLL